jgi:hypothetical protein
MLSLRELPGLCSMDGSKRARLSRSKHLKMCATAQSQVLSQKLSA